MSPLEKPAFFKSLEMFFSFCFWKGITQGRCTGHVYLWLSFKMCFFCCSAKHCYWSCNLMGTKAEWGGYKSPSPPNIFPNSQCFYSYLGNFPRVNPFPWAIFFWKLWLLGCLWDPYFFHSRGMFNNVGPGKKTHFFLILVSPSNATPEEHVKKTQKTTLQLIQKRKEM